MAMYRTMGEGRTIVRPSHRSWCLADACGGTHRGSGVACVGATRRVAPTVARLHRDNDETASASCQAPMSLPSPSHAQLPRQVVDELAGGAARAAVLPLRPGDGPLP